MGQKILLVDDEEGIRKVLGITLADIGYEVLPLKMVKKRSGYFQRNSATHRVDRYQDARDGWDTSTSEDQRREPGHRSHHDHGSWGHGAGHPEFEI